MLEIAGGILIAAFILIIFATIIEPWQSRVAIRKVRKDLEVMKNTTEEVIKKSSVSAAASIITAQFCTQFLTFFQNQVNSKEPIKSSI